MKMQIALLFLILGTTQWGCVRGHGRLLVPPSRASMWRNLKTGDPMLLPYASCIKPNFDDNALYCGGFSTQQRNGGRCGVCGDSYSARVKQHEAPNGKYAKGIITRKYEVGETITVKVEITAAHKGYFEFRLCPLNNSKQTVTHECLNRFLLTFENDETKWYLPEPGRRTHSIQVNLPRGLRCQQCVLQWRYRTGNSWGTDKDGTSGLGKGPQEEFYACADIAIGTSKKFNTLCNSNSSSTARPGGVRPTPNYSQLPWSPSETDSTTRLPRPSRKPRPSKRPRPSRRPNPSQKSRFTRRDRKRCKKQRNNGRFFCLGCNEFYRCVYRAPVLFQCPPGTSCDRGLCTNTSPRC